MSVLNLRCDDDLLTSCSKARVQPKAAGATKATAAATTAGRGTARGVRARGRRGRNAGRGKPKSAAELDAEMTDYFVGGSGNTENADANTNGAAPTGGDDLGMDGISVG